MRKALALALVSFPLFAAEGQIEAPGIPNFHQVNQRVFRGGQPTDEGWNSLAKLGVKVVIDLRRENEGGEHSTNAEAKAVEAAGMRYVHVPMKGFFAPKDEDVAKVLALLDGPDPVFVHCKKGMDRTGTVIACYRISRDQWTNKKAKQEAKAIGLHWYEFAMKRYLSNFNGSTTASASPVATSAPDSRN